MTIAEKIKYEGGYTVEIHYDEDAYNPMQEFDGQPSLILHDKAESHFGWTTDEGWAHRLHTTLETLAERAYERRQKAVAAGRPFNNKLYGAGGALHVFARWAKAFYGVVAILPISALEHSGTVVYLGDSDHPSDPGGWDSGWVGFVLITKEQWLTWGNSLEDTSHAEGALRGSFKEFADWVEGATYGYVVTHEDHEVEDDSCWGFYGYESFDERIETELPAVALHPGMKVKMRDGSTDEITAVYRDHTEGGAQELNLETGELGAVLAFDGVEVSLEYASGEQSTFWETDTITVVHPGYMREQFEGVIAADRKARAEDEAEIDELRLAEAGV